jgi:hypothetical protein
LQAQLSGTAGDGVGSDRLSRTLRRKMRLQSCCN